MIDCCVIVLGGDPIPRRSLGEIPEERWVIAADSGLDHALALGLAVDLVIGDLDSVSEQALDAYSTVPRQIHPPDKDATDFELAMDVALAHDDLARLIVLGGHGGRIDHFLGNLAVISAPRLSQLEVEWIGADQRIHIVHRHVVLHGHRDATVSLVPVTDRVEGVLTSGLVWELVDATLDRHSSRGISNRFKGPRAQVRIRSGVLAVIQDL